MCSDRCVEDVHQEVRACSARWAEPGSLVTSTCVRGSRWADANSYMGLLYRVVPRNGVRIAQHRKGGKSLTSEKSAGRYCEKVSVRCHTPQRPLVGTVGCFDSASLARPVFVEVHVTPLWQKDLS